MLRNEIGKFVDAPLSGSKTSYSAQSQMFDGSRLVESRFQSASDSTYDEGEVRSSPTGRWIWHFSERSGLVTLQNALTSDICGTHRLFPETPDGATVDSEYIVATFREAPDALTLYANQGDNLACLFTLIATDAGIRDPAGARLFESVAECLDETLWAARFVSADRFLAIDDVGNLTLFTWPNAVRVAELELPTVFQDEDEDDLFRIWPDDDLCEELVIDEVTFVVGNTLLVSLCDGANPDDLLALVAIDAQTLRPLGLVRPPTRRVTELSQVGDEEFEVLDAAGLRRLRFLHTEIRVEGTSHFS